MKHRTEGVWLNQLSYTFVAQQHPRILRYNFCKTQICMREADEEMQFENSKLKNIAKR